MSDTCTITGKRRLTRRQALVEARWWRRSMFARMAHYRCRSCGSWHVGNASRKMQPQILCPDCGKSVAIQGNPWPVPIEPGRLHAAVYPHLVPGSEVYCGCRVARVVPSA